MPTEPITYRVSPEVDAQLKRLAEIHGGVDKALRVLLEWDSPLPNEAINAVSIETVAQRPNSTFVAPVVKRGKFQREMRPKGDKTR